LKLRFHDDFKKDYRRIIKLVMDSKALDSNLRTIAHILLSGGKLPDKYATNDLLCDGTGWYETFVYDDGKHTIIMQYKIQGQRIYLARLGTPSVLSRKRKLL